MVNLSDAIGTTRKETIEIYDLCARTGGDGRSSSVDFGKEAKHQNTTEPIIPHNRPTVKVDRHGD